MMAALIRSGLRKSRILSQSFSCNVFLKELKKVPELSSAIVTARCLATVPDKKKHLLIDVHSRIDHNMGISTKLFNSLLSSVEEIGLTEHDVALLLHICSLGPFDSSSKDRLQFAEEIWNKLGEMGVQPTSKLYNMKLKAYCANDQNFAPVDELTAMKSMGINPDKITYGFLIEGFCRNGDISGANHVLEAMSDAQIFIGVPIFNSFITGHLKAGSPEEASNVLETMRSRGLTANSDTYYRFIHHYAMEGDVETVIKYIKEAENDGAPLDQSLLLKVYRSMLLNGQGSEAKQILPMLLEKDVFRQSSMQNLCQLVAEGFPDEALDLYLNIPKVVTDSTPVTAGAFLLKTMIINEQNVENVIEVADKLLESKPNTLPHRYALLYAYKMDKPELAVKLLEVLISRKYDVRIPHIVPALCHYRDSGNLEGVYKTVDMILSLDPIEELMDTLDMFCYPTLKQMNQSDEDILAKMKNHETKWNTFFMLSELKKGGYEPALEHAVGKPMDKDMVSWLENNRQLLLNYHPKEACVRLLSKLTKKNYLSKYAALSVLMKMISENDLDAANHFLDVFKKENIRLPDRFLGFKQVTEAPQEIKDKLKEVCEIQPFFQKVEVLSMQVLKEKSKEELIDYVKKNPNHILARVALLNKAIFEKDLTEVHKRLREIQATQFSFPKFQLVSIITALAELGDIEMATQYFTELQDTHGNMFADTVPLSLAAKLVEAGDVKGALEMIDAAKQSNVTKVPGKEYIRKSKITFLFSSVKTMEEAEAIHEALVKSGSYLTGEDANIAHGHYIKKALESDDDRRLLERLSTLRDHYWAFPCMNLVVKRFIQKQDIESLKKVMDLGVSVVGNNVFHHILASCFISCDMPSKAASIFQKLDNKLNSNLLETNCNYFIKNKQVGHVESLVEMVKTLPVSRAFMLKQLIKAYVHIDDMVKVGDVLLTFENELLEPDKSSLDILVSAYKKHNMAQPEMLKAFLSKRKTTDQVKPYESGSSSDSSSDSSSESDLDMESTQADKEQAPQPDMPVTETKTP